MKKFCYFSIFITILFLTSSFSYGRGGTTSCRSLTNTRQCMVCNCYNEAGNEPLSGQVAVGEVVMSRVGSDHWPNSVCGVIKQRKQFSWYHLHRRTVPRGHRCNQAADQAMKFRGCKADHYHATYVRPRWRLRMTRVKRIQTHIFYSKFCRRTNMVKAMQKQRAAVSSRYRNRISSEVAQQPRATKAQRTRRRNKIYTPRVRTASTTQNKCFFLGCLFRKRNNEVSL